MFVLALSHFYGEFLRNSLAGSKCLSSNEKPQGTATSAPHFSGFAPEDEGQNSTSPEKPGSMILGRAYINMEQTVSLEAYMFKELELIRPEYRHGENSCECLGAFYNTLQQ